MGWVPNSTNVYFYIAERFIAQPWIVCYISGRSGAQQLSQDIVSYYLHVCSFPPEEVLLIKACAFFFYHISPTNDKKNNDQDLK